MAAPINLNKVIDEGLLNSFTGLSKKSSGKGSTALAAALNGGGGSKTSVTEGLRLGARAFAGAVQGINAVIGFVNVANSTLEKLAKVADKLINVVEQAADPATQHQTRRRLNLTFKKLGKEFVTILDDSQISDRAILDTQDLKEIFVNIGLDEADSESVKEVFDQFQLNNDDTKLADDEIKGPRPAEIPSGAYKYKTTSGTKTLSKHITEFSSIFDAQRKIDRRPDAYLVLNDLKELRSQIDNNQKALSDTTKFLEDNLELVRNAGFAFLNLSDQVKDTDKAFDVARLLRQEIRKSPAKALAQAENLEPLAVAALAFEDGGSILK